MPIEIGRIEAIFRHPVKSMRGEAVDAATLAFHGLAGRVRTPEGSVPTSSSGPRARFPSRRMDGEGDDAPAVAVTMRDVRCAMVNLDPDGGSSTPEVLKAVVRANQNNAGIYGTVTRTGRLTLGQTVFLHR